MLVAIFVFLFSLPDLLAMPVSSSTAQSSVSQGTRTIYNFFVFILFPTGAVQIIIISIIRPILFLFQVSFLLNFFFFFHVFQWCSIWFLILPLLEALFLSSSVCGSSPCCLLFLAFCLLSNCSFTFSLFLYFFPLCNEWGSSAPPLSFNIICNRES